MVARRVLGGFTFFKYVLLDSDERLSLASFVLLYVVKRLFVLSSGARRPWFGDLAVHWILLHEHGPKTREPTSYDARCHSCRQPHNHLHVNSRKVQKRFQAQSLIQT